MTIKNPPANTSVNPTFSANGIYDLGNATTPAECILKNAGAEVARRNISLCADGSWVSAEFQNVAVGSGYTIDAFYTSSSGPVNAPQRTGITVSGTALHVDPRPCVGQDDDQMRVADKKNDKTKEANTAKTLTASGCGTRCCAQLHKGTYTVRLKFQKAVAVLSRDSTGEPVEVVPVLTNSGCWSVFVPVPSDYVSSSYSLYIMFLDRDGLPVIPPHRIVI